jgi:hypothetical protein
MPSSVIALVEYDREFSRLTVTFTSGRVYDYYAVSNEVASEFLEAPSKGAFFNTRIRDRFPFREVFRKAS